MIEQTKPMILQVITDKVNQTNFLGIAGLFALENIQIASSIIQDTAGAFAALLIVAYNWKKFRSLKKDKNHAEKVN